jgi:predicted metal-dependent hydrolase
MNGALQAGAGHPPVPCWNGDVLRTRLFDGLSLLLPAGEEFVIRAMQEWLDTHPDAGPWLRAEAGRFVQEERAHQRAHRRYNAELAAATPVAAEQEACVAQAVRQLDALGLPMRLALAEAFEHLTALLSAEVLRGHVWISAESSRQARMWRWHCAEELGHRHVTAEVLRSTRLWPGQRSLALVLATFYIGGDAASLTWALCRQDVRRGRARVSALAAQAGRLLLRAGPSLLRMALGWCGHFVPRRR